MKKLSGARGLGLGPQKPPDRRSAAEVYPRLFSPSLCEVLLGSSYSVYKLQECTAEGGCLGPCGLATKPDVPSVVYEQGTRRRPTYAADPFSQPWPLQQRSRW